jgi:hypothetical protein
MPVNDSNEPKPLSPATIAIHGGTPARDTDAPVVRPLVQSVNFIQEVGSGDGLRYPRYGNSPNAIVVQERMAALEGAEEAVLLSSGMGAIACALIALLRPGDRQRHDLRRRHGAPHQGIPVARHRRHVHRPVRDARVAEAPAKDDTRHLRRVARQPDVPGPRPQAGQPSHPRARHRPRR